MKLNVKQVAWAVLSPEGTPVNGARTRKATIANFLKNNVYKGWKRQLPEKYKGWKGAYAMGFRVEKLYVEDKP